MSNKNKSQDKATTEATEPVEGVSVITDADAGFDTFEYDEVEAHPMLTFAEALFLNSGNAKVGGLLDIIGSLTQMGWIADALNLVKLLTNRESKWGDILSAIEAIYAKLQNRAPVPPKMLALAARPKKEDVLKHIADAGVNVSFIPTSILGIVISLAMKFGLPIIQAWIESWLANQKKGMQY